MMLYKGAIWGLRFLATPWQLGPSLSLSSEDEQPPPKLARQQAMSDPVVDEPMEVEAEPEPTAPPPETETETQSDGDSLDDGTDYSLLLATAHKYLRHEYVRLAVLYDKDRAKFYTWKHGYPRFLMFALWLGVGEDDTLVPMRADFEMARVGHEITIENDQVLFSTSACNKTKWEIRFNLSKHCPAVANIIKKIYEYVETECNGYLFPSLKNTEVSRSSRQTVPRDDNEMLHQAEATTIATLRAQGFELQNHNAPRLVTSPRRREQMRQWRLAHPGYMSATGKRHYHLRRAWWWWWWGWLLPPWWLRQWRRRRRWRRGWLLPPWWLRQRRRRR